MMSHDQSTWQPIGAYLEMATGGTGRIDIAQAPSTLAGALGAQQPAQQSAQQPARQPIPHLSPQPPLPPQPLLSPVNQIPGNSSW